MPSWAEFCTEAPDLAAQVRSRFGAHRHKTMATVRRDGAPRISGTEVAILGEQMYLAGMTGAVRFADLRRDPRVAVHSGSDDPEVWTGDAKVAGTAVELLGPADHEAFRAAAGEVPPGPFELFRLELSQASVVRLADGGDHLVIDIWRAGQGVRSVERR
jgi:hypothetical protein